MINKLEKNKKKVNNKFQDKDKINKDSKESPSEDESDESNVIFNSKKSKNSNK